MPNASSPEPAGAGGPSRRRALAYVMRLCEIEGILAHFESVEATLPAVTAVLARALSLHTVILAGVFGGRSEAFAWRAPGRTEAAFAAARLHARQSYAYLVSPPRASQPDLGSLEPLVASASEAAPVLASEASMFVALPLVVTAGDVFGVMQIGAAAPLDEEALVFIAAVVRQVAAALHGRALEDARLRLHAMMEGIVALASDGTVVLDAALRIQVFNEGAATLFATSSKEALGAPLSRLFEPAEELKIQLFAGDPSRLHERMEIVRRGDGHDERAVEVTLAKLALDGRSMLALVARDVTDRRCLEMAKAVLLETLAARPATGEPPEQGGAPPLAVVLANAATLWSGDGPDAVAEPSLREEPRSSHRVDRVVRDLVDASLVEASRFTVDPRRIHLAPLVTRVLDGARDLAARAQVILHSMAPMDLPPVHADEGRVEQVLETLLENAIDTMHAGGTISVCAERTWPMVRVTVRDTGPGIPRAELRRLFERPWQVRRGAEVRAGLGLFLVRAIVLAHGGELHVESSLRRGTTFAFTLPMAERTERLSPRSPALTGRG